MASGVGLKLRAASGVNRPQAANFEGQLMKAIMDSGAFKVENEDEEGDDAQDIMDDERDLNLEAAAASGFDIGSTGPIGK
eukprot:58361-Pyramimonas_sp.AAC.1